VHKKNNWKGSIYMAFDYSEYDLTGLMESVKYKFTEAQVQKILPLYSEDGALTSFPASCL
jgi:cyclin-dependent kinase 12/13